ncbi:MAG TPA: type II secretion system F family protein [Candidatus Paceibacterota bacterium]
MPIYKYKYLKDGEEKEEVKTFQDKGELYVAVRAENGSILSVEEVESRRSLISFFSFRRGISAEEQIAFAKNMAVMIEAGLSISRALSVLQKQSKNKNFIELLKSISEAVNSGETLSKSLEARPDVFSGLFVSMVRAGEESGKLSFSLRIIASQLEKSHSLSKKIKGAMIYPSVIIFIMIVIGIVLMVYMVPTLTETFIGLNIELPLPTRIVIAISNFLRQNVLITFGSLLAVAFILAAGIKTKKGQNIIDTITLHTPMIGTMSKEVNAARTARTLSSLISSGVDIVSALGITSKVLQNHYFKEVIDDAAKKVELGEQLSESLSASSGRLYPVFVGEMLAVGEETGKMGEMLENIADYYEGEVDQKTKDLSTIIEPFLMVIIGVAVGLFAVAMMLPTYSLVDAIQ